MNSNSLSEREIVRLGTFLLSDAVPEGTLGVDGLDGCFTAALCGPLDPDPLEVVRAFLGPHMIWKSTAAISEIYELMFRHWNSIADALGRGEWRALIDSNVEPELMGRSWAAGFCTFLFGESRGWGRFMADRDSKILLAPMLTLSGIFDEKAKLEPMAPREREFALECLAPAVAVLYDYWREDRDGRVAARIAQAPGGKIGRNDPCPCGSGRKFKRCCG